MDKIKEFQKECEERIAGYSENKNLMNAAHAFMVESTMPKYCYNYKWLGRPIIQYPQDIVAMQEIIWEVKPDLIIETGIAHGGSLIFSASMLALLELMGEVRGGHVLGIDIDIREHNRAEIEKHPLSSRITMMQGSSIDEKEISRIKTFSEKYKKILVCLDSNHTHDHALAELKAYAPLVSAGSYCVVFDTIIEDLPDGLYPDRPWGKGNNPKTAVWEYLKSHPEFTIDKNIHNKLLISVAPEGFLKRIL